MLTPFVVPRSTPAPMQTEFSSICKSSEPALVETKAISAKVLSIREPVPPASYAVAEVSSERL